MLKLFEAMAWLCSTYIILLSTQYFLALYYQRGPSSQPISSGKHTVSRNRSPFLFRDLNSLEEQNSSEVLFYVSGSPTFDLAKNTFAQIRKHYINPVAVYSFQPRSRLFHGTTGNLQLLSQQIEYAASRLPYIRRGKLTKLIFIATEDVSESLLRYLAICSHSQLQLIDSVFFVNPTGSSSANKQLHIEDMMFKGKTKQLLEERKQSLKQIRVVVITTDKSKENAGIAYPYTIKGLWADVVQMKTVEMWNIYRQFDEAYKLFAYKPFLEVFSGFLTAEYASQRNLTQIYYYFRYGEPLVKAKGCKGSNEQQSDFKILCPSSLQISFSDKQQSLMTSSRCFSITINEQQSLSLLIRSTAQLNVFTANQQSVIPYYFNQTFFMYFIENTNNSKTFHVSNPRQVETTISYTQIIHLSESNITGKKGNTDLQFAKVIRLPKIPLKVCTSQDLDLPPAGKDTCFESQGATIFRWKDVQLNFHLNNQELYGRLFTKYEYLHVNLVFANLIALVFLSYKYSSLIFINIVNLIIACQDPTKSLLLALYIFFVLSLCQLCIKLLQRLIEIRSKIRLKPIVEAFILVLPSVIGICRLINFQLFVGSQWISLLFSYFIVVGTKGEFIGLYLMYLSWDYILQGQPTYHFVIMLLWMYSLYFQGDLYVYESERIQALTQTVFFVMLFYCLECQAFIHILSEAYVIQFIGILMFYTIKRQKILRRIHSQLRVKQPQRYKL